MKDLLIYEIRKHKNRKFIIIAGVAVLLFYMVMGLTGKITLYGPWDAEYFLTHVDYRNAEKSMQHGVVDETYAANFEKDYREYIDAHRLSDVEIKANLEEDQETVSVENCLYDIEYAYYVLSSEDLNSSKMNTFLETYSMIGYAKNPSKLFTKFEQEKAYSPTLAADYLKCVKTHIEDLQLVAGYHYGWDVMVSINSQLPYTLGIFLIVCFFAIFAVERETGMRPLMQVSKYGRKKAVTAKLLYAWGVTTMAWLVFQIVALIGTSIVYGLEGGDCTVYEEPFIECPYGFSYIQYYFYQCAIGYLGTLAFMLLIFVLSSLLRGRLALMVGLGVILVTTFPLERFSNSEPAFNTLDKIKVLMPTQIMSAFSTFQNYQGYVVGNTVIRLPQMTLIAVAVEILALLAVVYRREGK